MAVQVFVEDVQGMDQSQQEQGRSKTTFTHIQVATCDFRQATCYMRQLQQLQLHMQQVQQMDMGERL